MTGISTGEATLLAARFPWKRFKTFVDMGCAQGALPVRVALTHPHLRGTGFDLPVVEPIFTGLDPVWWTQGQAACAV